jgi:hypothetical protein
MCADSDPLFRTHHALRIKGFATTEVVAEVAGHDLTTAEQHLRQLQDDGLVQFREVRSLWQLTPDGRVAHAAALASDRETVDSARLGASYAAFLGLNERFKALCGDWQLRDGEPNDHSDAEYDAAVIERLVALNDEAVEIVGAFGEGCARLGDYGPRLAQTCRRVAAGEMKMLTGVMCGSYHDVWMELHEDLILTQGIDRAKEGSF